MLDCRSLNTLGNELVSRMRIWLPVSALLLSTPAIAVIARRSVLFLHERGISVGGDVVVMAYLSAVIAVGIAATGVQVHRSRWSVAAFGVCAVVFVSLIAAHLARVFVPHW